MKRSAIRLLLPGVLALLAVLAYVPGLSGPFVFDDFPNIVKNPSVMMHSLDAASFRDAASLHGESYKGRGLARLSFALNYYFAGRGFSHRAFKTTNLVIHLINAALVYVLAGLLLRSLPRRAEGACRAPAWLPLLVAGLWALHPLQLTSVLYVVQRMTSLAGGFVLLGLATFVLGRRRFERGQRWGPSCMLAGVVGGTALGFLCKENAVLLAYFAALIEWFFFDRAGLKGSRIRWLAGFYMLAVLVPTLVGVVFLASHPGFILDSYMSRDYTLGKRLLSESRVMFFYLSLWIYPNLRRFGLFHDDIALSTGLLEPWTTALALLGWGVILGAALGWGVRRRSVWAFGVLWFVVGHALESTLIGLELVFEHRNYMPSVGLAIASAYYLMRLFQHGEGLRRLAPMVVIVVLGVLGFTTHVRAGIWADLTTLTSFMARNHPDSGRSVGVAAFAELTRGKVDVRETYKDYRRAAAADPSAVVPLIRMAEIVSGLRALAHRAPPGHATATPPANALEADVLVESGYLDRLLQEIDKAIRHRLREFAVRAETTVALINVGKCIDAGGRACVQLAPLLVEWATVASANPRIKTIERIGLTFELAGLHAGLGHDADAVRYARLGRALRPDEAALWLKEAEIYIRLRRWRDVDTLLERMDKALPASPLRERIRRAAHAARLGAVEISPDKAGAAG